MSETFNLIIDPSSLPNGVTSSNNVTVTILDQDAVNVKFSKQKYTYKEGNKGSEISVNLIFNNPSSSDIILQVQNSDFTATGDVDYTSGPYIVTFPAGMITASFNIPILDDNVLENDEQFQLSIIFNSLPDRVTISDPSQTTVTIRDDDDITVTFKQSMYYVDEDEEAVKPTLVLSNPSSTNITITVNTRDNAATESDYMSGQYTVVFLPNAIEVSFNIPVFEDEIREDGESFILTITDRTQPRKVNIGQRSQTIVNIGDTTGELIVNLLTYLCMP
ncbi:sodium/calcium exchanger Calx-like [Dysidea avara]|uniref:sodium/calcium exchanger Calx-like n=1 Tax=Dysidea avara TaxID=196820 RepID=UPI00331AAD48